jgi:predicted metalloendopeptidase
VGRTAPENASAQTESVETDAVAPAISRSSKDHVLMDKKCDQSGMRDFVERQVNRNPKTYPSILFAMMNQCADEDIDIEETVIVNNLDEEHADKDGSDIEAQVNWNIATERDPEFSRDVDAEDF